MKIRSNDENLMTSTRQTRQREDEDDDEASKNEKNLFAKIIICHTNVGFLFNRNFITEKPVNSMRMQYELNKQVSDFEH